MVFLDDYGQGIGRIKGFLFSMENLKGWLFKIMSEERLIFLYFLGNLFCSFLL